MATIFGSIGTLIHDTANSLVEKKIMTKMSDMYAGFVAAGFGILDDTLKVVRDVTATKPPPPAP
jgi:hypothetical protein